MPQDKKIGLIGRINPAGELFDGQTVKTRTIWRMLCERYGSGNVVTVETMNYKREPLRVLREYLRCMRKCNDIVVLLSNGGRRFFFPLLANQAQRHGKRVYHDLIGGWLAQNAQEDPRIVARVNTFEVNWVESRDLVDQLRILGVTNAEFMPNFKQITPVMTEELSQPRVPPRRMCTFSRVLEKKGILDAIGAVKKLSERDGLGSWELDIYGPVDSEFETQLHEAIDTIQYISYRGSVAPEDSVDTLISYWALLFPTKWQLEGFPGTVVDALAAGVPIVSSRWRYYTEMLEDGVTGTSYEFGGGVDGLVSAIDDLKDMEEDGRMLDIKRACVIRFTAYSADELFGKMCERIEAKW